MQDTLTSFAKSGSQDLVTQFFDSQINLQAMYWYTVLL